MKRIICIRYSHCYPAVFLVLWLVFVPLIAAAEQFTGKVVGVSDGDTISVLREGKAVKVRLHGVDTPEKAQAFGTQARKFTSDLAFQQTVTVEVHTTDRYTLDTVTGQKRYCNNKPRVCQGQGRASQCEGL